MDERLITDKNFCGLEQLSLKLREFRNKGEFLTDGRYWEEELWINSPYGTILTYDKEGTIVRAH